MLMKVMMDDKGDDMMVVMALPEDGFGCCLGDGHLRGELQRLPPVHHLH